MKNPINPNVALSNAHRALQRLTTQMQNPDPSLTSEYTVDLAKELQSAAYTLFNVAKRQAEKSMPADIGTRVYRFISDPGHGWLEVPRSHVVALGVVPSEYSYQQGDFVYLEEDCDASAFVEALKANGFPVNFSTRVTYVHQDPTPIREYARAKGFGV